MAEPESPSIVYRGLVGTVRLVLPLLVKRSWSGLHRLPGSGPVLVVSNHTSNFDAITLADALVAGGRWPRFLGKADIWRVPFIGWLAVKCRQIPVERNTERAKDALIPAAAALADGECVALYPEGTITRDPSGWPMLGRRGAARLALTSSAPVVPVVQHGPDQVLGGRYLELRKLFSFRRRVIKLVVGEPIALDDLRGPEPTEEQIAEATSRIMSEITRLYGELVGEPIPEIVWSPWEKGYVKRPG